MGRNRQLADAVKERIDAAVRAGEAKYRERASLVDRASYWLKPRLFMHGNLWCALLGDDVQSGIAGFGYTPAQAFDDFDRRPLPDELVERAARIKAERLAVSSSIEFSPSWFLQPTELRDGSDFWVQYGDNPQDGVAGFASTLDEAYERFDRLWFTHAGPLGCVGRGEE